MYIFKFKMFHQEASVETIKVMQFLKCLSRGRISTQFGFDFNVFC